MLTYYTIFALFPFAILIVSLTLLFMPPDVLTEAFEMITIAMPGPVSTLLIEQLQRMEQAAAGGFAAVSAAVALYGASRGAVALQTALNEIHGVEESRSWWKVQLTALTVTIGVTLLVIAALALLVVGPAVGHFITYRFGFYDEFEFLWSYSRWLGAGPLVMLVWACMYYFLPNIKRRFRWTLPGAIVAVLLWLAVCRGFIFYADNYATYDKTYGALGVVIVFLTWLWLSCVALLVGGVIDDAIDEVRKQKEPAGQIPSAQAPHAFPVNPPPAKPI